MTFMTESFSSLTKRDLRKNPNKVSIYKPPTKLLQMTIVYIGHKNCNIAAVRIMKSNSVRI